MLPGAWLRSQEPHRQRGQAAVEFTVLLPLLLALFLGVVEMADALRSYIALVNAAREGARLAARGDVFDTAEILLVIQQHAGSVDIAGAGAVLKTTVTSDATGFTQYTAQTLTGAASSRFTETGLSALHQQLSVSEPGYLRRDRFVIIEIFYTHSTIVGFFGATLPMYTYTVMPISALQ